MGKKLHVYGRQLHPFRLRYGISPLAIVVFGIGSKPRFGVSIGLGKWGGVMFAGCANQGARHGSSLRAPPAPEGEPALSAGSSRELNKIKG
jgi:hypothetical protein